MSTTTGRRIPRPRALVILCVVLVAALYAVVVALYAASGQVDIADDVEPGPDAAVLRISPERIDAVGNRLVIEVLPVATGPLGGEDAPFAPGIPFSVVVTGADGTRTIDVDAGEVLSPNEVALVTEGAVERWPFDVYTVQTLIFVAADLDGDGAAEPVPTVLVGDGRVPGWNVSAAERDTDEGFRGVLFTAVRSGSTVAFGIVLLSLMIAMPALVLTVAVTVYRGRRKVEATMLSWIGAMLFATIPLRNFLPGNPPIGSWVDYLIVLWVIAGLVAGLVVFVAAWLRLGPDGPASDPRETPPPDAVNAPPRS